MAGLHSDRPSEPIFNVDEKEDLKVFYHNKAYKVNRIAINVEKMKIMKDRVQECYRKEGVNFIDRCDQLVKRYEAAVRVCNWNQGPYQRVRNVGNIVEKEREIKAQVESEGGLVA
eukprot:jgi/Chrzof1/14553/Cz09g07050.t1